MVDYWNDRPVHGTKARVPVMLINDLDQPWHGPVTLRVKRGERALFEAKQDCRLEPLGEAEDRFRHHVAGGSRAVRFGGELRGADGEAVQRPRH